MKMKMLLLLSMLIGVSAVVEAADDFPIREIVRYPTKEEMRADYLRNGKWLMELKGIPDGDETLVCLRMSGFPCRPGREYGILFAIGRVPGFLR